MNKEQLAQYFDHTILKPSATTQEVLGICNEAIQYGFYSVCVNSTHVNLVANTLKDTQIKTCSVVGFPLGASTPEAKAFETSQAIENGATEIDMVINIGALLDKKYDIVEKDIKAVVDAAKGNIVKVIIETCFLTDQQKVKACELALQAGAHFVKTSTGFGTGGATIADIKLMRDTVGSRMQVKASGGIKDLTDTRAMIDAGADRIGASAGVKIMKEMG